MNLSCTRVSRPKATFTCTFEVDRRSAEVEDVTVRPNAYLQTQLYDYRSIVTALKWSQVSRFKRGVAYE